MADEESPRIQLSAAQVAASCLAAVSAAVICSFFGVAGTVIGTAVASIVATTGSALYSHSLRRTRARLRRMHKAGAVSPPLTEVMNTARAQGRRLWSQLPVRVLALGALGVFVVSIAIVTAIELGLGQSLAAAFGVSHSGAHGTSIESMFKTKHHHPTPTPTPTNTPTSPAATPSHTPSTTPSPTATETVTAPPSTPPPSSSPPNPVSSLLSPSSK